MKSPNILLGVTGGIAAYKTPELVRRLRDRGANVQVVMTRGAGQFVTETTLQAVSGNPVRENLWDKDAEAAMGHIELARWADQVIVAPATAEFMARLAAGAAPDLLATLCLATEAPLTLAPAMNRVMWANPAVQDNRRAIERRGIRILGPAEGDQACGESGAGRMVEPDDIVTALLGSDAGRQDAPLNGRTVIITAGPTREAIDPVRYISNHSSGKMGYAMSEAARDAGARVILLSGPVSIPAPESVEVVNIETAEELFAATRAHIGLADIFIAAAAVSDYRPESVEQSKIKKSQDGMTLKLTRSPDILASVAALKDGPFTVGFAAETDKVRDYALGKLKSKQLDMIIANKVGKGLAFGQDDNAVQVFWRGGEKAYPRAAKTELARDLTGLIAEHFAGDVVPTNVTELPSLAEKT